jgi:hypothetical protein
MQIAGNPTRVQLTADLTRYHNHLVPGVMGTTIPNVKVGIWGSQDRFVAVRFDCCGETLDILWNSLKVNEE